MENYETLNKKAEKLKELRNDLFNNIGACNNIISVLKKHHLETIEVVEFKKNRSTFYIGGEPVNG